MNFSPFSCPIFLGHTEARGRCSQGERMLYGRDLCRSGGTGKAEGAKLRGAGIGPKQCPGKCAAEKGRLTQLSENSLKNQSCGSQACILQKATVLIRFAAPVLARWNSPAKQDPEWRADRRFQVRSRLVRESRD